MSAYPDYLRADPSLPGNAGSYWLASAQHTARPTLEAELDADVVVIGAGLAGILCAYELSEEGRKVILLEGRSILGDVTGHTTAKATVVHGSVLSGGVAKLGEHALGMHVAENRLAIARMRELAEKHAIDCGMQRVDTIAYVETQDAMRHLDLARNALLAGSVEPHETDREELPVRAAGAFCVQDELRFHPVKFGAGVLAQAERLGTVVFENSRVVHLEEEEDRVVATTAGGKVTARCAVVATNYPFHDHGSLFSRLFPHRSYVLGAYIAQELPDRFYIAYDDALTLRMQPAEKGQMVVASAVHHRAGAGGDERDRYHQLERMLRERYDVLDIPWHWSAQDNHTPDDLPFIGRSPGLEHTYVVTGFAAWGMSQSMVAGRMIRELVAGRGHPLADLYDPLRFEAGKPGATFLKENVQVTKEFATGLFAEGGTDDLHPGEGRRVRQGVHRVAAYRDYDGTLHQVSAACTHVGCGIEFNDAEKTWDCPCHGSRFSVDGRVLHAPAVRDLEPR